jgi:LmbE family N-acetylglucosaminyl deacetylase
VNVVVVAPHPDDEAIGCGGSLCQHAARGDRVAVVFLTSGERGLPHLPREEAWRIREREAASAAEVLGIASVSFLRLPDYQVSDDVALLVRHLRALLEAEAPSLVYLPHAAEWHPDHYICAPAVRKAVGDVDLENCIGRAYEIWTPLQSYSTVENISGTMRRKLRAVRCHASQIERFRYDYAVRGLNAYRGVMTQRGRFAEVFGGLDCEDSKFANASAGP